MDRFYREPQRQSFIPYRNVCSMAHEAPYRTGRVIRRIIFFCGLNPQYIGTPPVDGETATCCGREQSEFK